MLKIAAYYSPTTLIEAAAFNPALASGQVEGRLPWHCATL